MADYDSNMIKPVNGLKNIAGLNPAKRRQERRRKRQLHQEDEKKDETTPEQDSPPHDKADNKIDIDSDSIGIDYCA
jgi:hypothetical protein